MINEYYKNIIDKVPEDWDEIVSKNPFELTEEDLYKIVKAVYEKFNFPEANDDEKLKELVKGDLAVKNKFPEIFESHIQTELAIVTGNYDDKKEFFKAKVAHPYFPSR